MAEAQLEAAVKAIHGAFEPGDTNEPAAGRAWAMSRIGVALLGATGNVGQKFALMLQDHPWFEIVAVAASGQSAGKAYGEAVAWKQAQPIPPGVSEQVVRRCDDEFDCPIVFSALSTEVAGEAEKLYASRGQWVFSNAGAHRMDTDVPLVVAEVNAHHFDLVDHQQRTRGWQGAIVTNPNCSTIGLVLPLAPLEASFGVSRVSVVTLQALSGAGFPGVPALDAVANVIPRIGGEEEKIERETAKILGAGRADRIESSDVIISAQTTRVPVEEGHLLCVSVGLAEACEAEAVLESWAGFAGPPQELKLPSAPVPVLEYLEEVDRPQPRRDVYRGNGMAVTIGRLRPCPLLSYRFVTLSHNTIRGAAGASVLNAELALSQGRIPGEGVPDS